jgi:hypothetical protein
MSKDASFTKEDVKELLAFQQESMAQAMKTILAEARKPAPEHNKADYDQIIATLQETGLSTGVASIRASLDKAVEEKIITESDRSLAHAYLGAHKKEISDFEQAMADRAATAAGVIEKNANKRWMQEHGCAHAHQKSAGGGTHCVYVQDNGVAGSPGYIYCQKCEGRFRPDEPLMRRLDPQAIFDSAKFNELMSECVTTGAEIFG